MSATLKQVLALVGPLDDTPGFESPRERFRGFLLEQVTDFATLRDLIEDADRSPGEQAHRALQDAVVVLGRFLDFDTTFGAYQRLNGGVQFHGHWRSRKGLDVVLEILSARATPSDADELRRSMSAFAASSSDSGGSCIGLFALSSASPRDEHKSSTPFDLSLTRGCCVASIRTLLLLAEMAQNERITHDDVVQLFVSAIDVDVLVDLAARFRDGSADALHAPPSAESSKPVQDEDIPASHELEPAAESGESEPDFWATVVERADAHTFEQFVKSAIAKRGLLGAAEDVAHAGVACAGDWICFVAPGRGVLGQARISAVLSDGAPLMRHGDTSDRVYRLQDVQLYDLPIPPDPETEQSLVTRHDRAGIRGPLLLSVSRQRFELLTEGRTVDGAELPRRIEPLRLAHTSARRWMA